ncbi:hypothetical protein ACWFMI_23440 [Nocardiopsis terrae]|uniref:hypothetical protein n=1 Tax=Streptomyces sp. NPDC057554 TaxID=3350538 RepID=UPI0036875243
MSTPDPTESSEHTSESSPPEEVADTTPPTAAPDDDHPVGGDGHTNADTADSDGAEAVYTLMMTATTAEHAFVDQILAGLAGVLPAGTSVDHLSVVRAGQDDGEQDTEPVVALERGDRVHLRTSSGAVLGRVVKVREGEGRPAELTVEDEPLYGLWFSYPDGGPDGWVTRTDGSVVLGPLSEIVKVSISGATPRVFPSPAHPDELKHGGGIAAAFAAMAYGRPRPIAGLAYPNTDTTKESSWMSTA